MYDFQPNSDARPLLSLAGPSGPVVGAVGTVSILAPDHTTSVVTSQPLTAESTPGVYSCTIIGSSLTQLGTYTCTWTLSAPASLVQVTTFTVGYESVIPPSFGELRRSLARMIEGKDCFATGTVASATNFQITDGMRVEPDNHWKGSWLLTYGGTGAGQETRVSGSFQSTNTLTVTPYFTTYPDNTTLYELHKLFSNEDFLEAVTTAIREVESFALIPTQIVGLTVNQVTPNAGAAGNAMAFEYVIPAGISHLYAVQVQMTDGSWRDIAPGYWSINGTNRVLTIKPRVVYQFPNYAMRIQGLRPPTLPLTDNSPIDVRRNYVLAASAANLCQMRAVGKETDQYARLGAFHEQKAQMEKGLIRRVPNNTRRIE